MLLLWPATAAAISQSDITWPTYSRVQFTTDSRLTCAALEDETRTTRADITLLNRAKARVEEVLHSAFDMERYGKTRSPGGDSSSIGATGGKEAYPAARQEIVASLAIANQRRDWLESLKPACKP